MSRKASHAHTPGTRLPKLILSAILICFGVMSVGEPARAGAQSARKLLAKGNKLFAKGDYAAAFEAFQAGNAKKASPVFLRSMVMCKLKLADHKAALELLSTYLSKYKKAKDRAKLSETRKKLEDIVKTVVKVSSTPPGAVIYVDALATRKRGETPKDITVEPGTHTLILRKKGFSDTTKTFTIKVGQTVAIPIALELPLVVSSQPPGAEVFVDGTLTGKTPLPDTARITPGEHKIEIKAAGYKTFTENATVAAGYELVAKLALGLTIGSEPAGAEVAINGKPKGKTPFDAELAPGSYKIALSLPGFKRYEKTVTVGPGVAASFIAKLQGGLLTMRTGPRGAKVTVGGIALGKTPLENVSVPMGKKTVEVEHPGRRPWSKALDFNDKTLIDAKIELGRPSWPFWALAGTALAGGILTGVAGSIALAQKGDYENPPLNADGKTDENKCRPTGSKQDFGSCNYTAAYLGEAGWVIAAVAGVAAIAYYIFWMRPSERIRRKARAALAAKKRRATFKAATAAHPQPAL